MSRASRREKYFVREVGKTTSFEQCIKIENYVLTESGETIL